MIIVNEDQTDALTELINIAFGLTAAKLSEITGQRVQMAPPGLTIQPMSTLKGKLGSLVPGPVTSVCQDFTSAVSGSAVLMLNSEDAHSLSNLLVHQSMEEYQPCCSTTEVLLEVGNMMLSSCIGLLGNLIHTRVTLSAPRLQVDSLELSLPPTTFPKTERQYAIVIGSSFKILEQRFDGRLLMIMGISSLKRLIQAVSEWDAIQLSA